MWPHQVWCGTGENDIVVLTCTHNQCFEQKYQNFQNISDDIFIFFLLKKSLYIVHGHVFSNVISKTHMWPSRNGLDRTERYLFQEISDNNLRKLWARSIELFEN